jgi:hypothetical protein
MNAIISRRVIHNTVDPVIFFLKCPSNFMLRRGTPEQSHQQLDRRTSKTTSRSGSNGVDQQFKFLSTLKFDDCTSFHLGCSTLVFREL